ncbi:MAG TPA: hypothetical protein PKY35_00390 [Candidatus Hydrogenedentes bacterium]|nr:hypothetical protein [Candidatus Hydrogenedentota bacterium]HOL75460.1 hypothetical protein [Candidatus Hydrogenedentota bacterium]HPO84969.1 hypothetical protein [Candidatus Hydrogenedentota bacterium]
MDIIIDGAKNFQPKEEPKDALSLLIEIIDFLRERGRGVLSVRLDGNKMAPDELVSCLKEKPLADIQQVEVESAEMSKLIQDALHELEEATAQLPDLCHQLAELFQSESPQHAYDPFQKLAEIWGVVKTRQIQIAQALSLDLESAEVQGTRFYEHHQALNQVLEEAAQALESGDCILLGDLLEYELAPRAEVERAIVHWLKSRSEA